MDLNISFYKHCSIIVAKTHNINSVGEYHIVSKYWGRHACANCVDSGQTPQNAASDQVLIHINQC